MQQYVLLTGMIAQAIKLQLAHTSVWFESVSTFCLHTTYLIATATHSHDRLETLHVLAGFKLGHECLSVWLLATANAIILRLCYVVAQ